MYSAKIHRSIDEIEQEKWNALARDNVYMCYARQKTFEETSAVPINPLYIVIREDDAIVGAVVCNLENKDDIAFNADKILFGRLKKYFHFLGVSFNPAMGCNPKNGYGAHYIIKNELSDNDKDKVICLLLDAVEKMAENLKFAVYFLNIMCHETQLITHLKKRGYLKTLGFPINYIDIKWSSFDEYKKFVF